MEKDLNPSEVFAFVAVQLKKGFSEFADKHAANLVALRQVSSPKELFNIYMNLMANEVMLSRCDVYGISMKDSLADIVKGLETSIKILDPLKSDSDIQKECDCVDCKGKKDKAN